MQRERVVADCMDDDSFKDRTLLLRSVFGGIIFGIVANVTALLFGHSLGIALLSHSVFGMLGMGLVLGLSMISFRTADTARSVTSSNIPRG